MESKIDVDADATKIEVITTDSIPMNDYLENLANEKIKIDVDLWATKDHKKSSTEKFDKTISELESKGSKIWEDLKIVLKNRKTVIKKGLSLELNNLLASAFPKEFKQIDPKPNPITTEDGLKCMRLIRTTNDLGEFGKFNCVEEFDTQEELDDHLKKHKTEGELI